MIRVVLLLFMNVTFIKINIITVKITTTTIITFTYSLMNVMRK